MSETKEEIRERVIKSCDKYEINRGCKTVFTEGIEKAKKRFAILHYSLVVLFTPIVLLFFLSVLILMLFEKIKDFFEKFFEKLKRLEMKIVGLKKQVYLTNLATRKNSLQELEEKFGNSEWSVDRKREIEVIEEIENSTR